MIVVYDAHCLLCSSSIQFLLRQDRQGALHFASMQGKTGQQLLAQAGANPRMTWTLCCSCETAARGARALPCYASCMRSAGRGGWSGSDG